MNTRTVRYTCNGPDELFTGAWEDMPQVWRDKICEMKGLGCDGGDVPGPWCRRGLINCPWFGGAEDEDDDEDEC